MMDGSVHRQESVGASRYNSQEWEEADSRSQCSQSDLGYHSAGASSDGRASHPGSSHLLTGELTGETHFPPSIYHSSVNAPKSDAATVCSGSVVEDIEVESIVSVEAGHQQIQTKHVSPPSSVKMAVGLRRTNSAGNRLVDFADRSHELLSAVIPQQRIRNGSFDGMGEEDGARLATAANGMGPPLSRALLLQGASSSRAESVKSFESNAASDLVAHVDTDDCGGSLVESITDVHSVLSQEEGSLSVPQEGAYGPSSDAKAAAMLPAESEDHSDRPHPLLSSQSDPQNGRTSPGGTIYRGRGVRRYQGRYMNLPLKRFHQDGVHLPSVDEHTMNESYNRFPPNYHDRDQRQANYNRRFREPRRGPRDRQNFFDRRRSRNRSRSRSRETPKNEGSSDDKNDSVSNRGNDIYEDRGRYRNGFESTHNGGYQDGHHREESASSFRNRGFRPHSGGRGYRNDHYDPPTRRNDSRNRNHRRRV